MEMTDEDQKGYNEKLAKNIESVLGFFVKED
jgi:hypothetical protein